jgi:hypothetical protein
LFSGVRDGELPTITYRRAWAPIDRLRMTGISLIYDPATRTLRTDTTDSLGVTPAGAADDGNQKGGRITRHSTRYGQGQARVTVQPAQKRLAMGFNVSEERLHQKAHPAHRS